MGIKSHGAPSVEADGCHFHIQPVTCPIMIARLRLLLLISCAGGLATNASRPDDTQATATRLGAAARERVEVLIRQLGDSQYPRREAAQAELTAMGDAAIAQVVGHVENPDREVASRALAICRASRAPTMRVAVALQLVESGQPRLLEQAVEMLFDDATATIEPFRRTASQPSAPRYVRAACAPILEQLETWIAFEKSGRSLYERHRTTKPEQATVDLENLEDQRRGLRFVAFSNAQEEILRVRSEPAPSDSRTASRPATRPYP